LPERQNGRIIIVRIAPALALPQRHLCGIINFHKKE
jgi:hypothetical protein